MSDLEYFTLKDILDEGKYPFTMRQIQGFVFNRHKNGLYKAIRKLGKRIYIKRDLFEAWIESHEKK